MQQNVEASTEQLSLMPPPFLSSSNCIQETLVSVNCLGIVLYADLSTAVSTDSLRVTRGQVQQNVEASTEQLSTVASKTAYMEVPL